MFSGCETADFILQECDIAAPVSSSSSFHYGEIPSNEQSGNRLEQGSRIQEPPNPTSCSYNPADEVSKTFQLDITSRKKLPALFFS